MMSVRQGIPKKNQRSHSPIGIKLMDPKKSKRAQLMKDLKVQVDADMESPRDTGTTFSQAPYVV